MTGKSLSKIPNLDLTEIDIFGVLSALDEGIIITDVKGRILFYNDTQTRIDELPSDKAIGRRVTDIYRLREDESMIMRCLAPDGRSETTFFSTGRIWAGRPIPSTVFFPFFAAKQWWAPSAL